MIADVGAMGVNLLNYNIQPEISSEFSWNTPALPVYTLIRSIGVVITLQLVTQKQNNADNWLFFVLLTEWWRISSSFHTFITEHLGHYST